jgi:hypothetical protein
VAYLAVLLGFGWPWERAAQSLRDQVGADLIEFLGRDRPLRWDERKFDYRNQVTRSLVSRLFGDAGATGFCGADGACATNGDRWSKANCKKSITEVSACTRRRPHMLLFVCHPNSFDLFFEKFARTALFVRAPEDATVECVGRILTSRLPDIKKIRDYLANLPNKNYAPRIPFLNFQVLGDHQVAADAQADLTTFCDVMTAYHEKLYSPDFQNQRKKFMRGAYLLDEQIGFQKDMLHSSAQLGAESRQDGYHLLNAFHMYGFPVTPGFHFDVSAVDGKGIGRVFTDVLDGHQSSVASTHVNVSPDDRLL